MTDLKDAEDYCNALAHNCALGLVGPRLSNLVGAHTHLQSQVTELADALRAIDAVACKHQRGAIGLAQDIARAALAKLVCVPGKAE